jgi:hypothetical protein
MIPWYLIPYILDVNIDLADFLVQQQQDPQYDIFENSSPQRPLNIYGGALANDSVDALVNQDGNINSSRKREFPPSSPARSPTRSPYDNNDGHGSKRHRSTHWPFSEDDTPRKNGTPSRRHVSTPGRSSRFLEASMHDRPSNKPPSAFTRHFNQHINASVDHLMDSYYETDKPLPDCPDSKALPRRLASRSPTKSPQRRLNGTHHANASTWSISTAATNEAEQAGETANTKGSGFFRFGKSMASAFNPVSIWQKVTTTFRDTKEDMIQEKLDERYGDRQAKAEQAYAELKQAGKLGSQGTKAIPDSVKVFTPGYTSQNDTRNQRDSGISMDDESRSSMDTNKASYLLAPAIDSPRRGSWHSRTPSFQNLKKIASMGNLHKRSNSGHLSISPEKEPGDASASLRQSSSKLDIKKQHKLSRRVSNLEAKLNAARRELNSSLAPPTVSSRSVTPVHPLPDVPHEEMEDGGTWKRRYAPALPTLLSERLLTAGAMLEDESSPARPTSSDVDTLTAIETQMDESPIRGITDGRFYMQPNEQLQPIFTFSSPPIKSEVAESEAMDLVQERPMTPKEPTSFLADPSSSLQKPQVPEKPTQRKRIVIKRKAGDVTYCPHREDIEEDDDMEEEKHKTLKKKRPSEAENSPKSKKSRASRVPTSTSPISKKPNVLTKPPPPPKVPSHVVEEMSLPRVSLETVHEHEEITTTTTITVKDAPSRPTARATPAHPSRARFDRSRSRSRSPRKTFGATTPSHMNRERRSLSPPPSSTVGTFAAENDDIPITAKPNGRDVPPMPMRKTEGSKLEKKESFEWPDDVF